MLRRISEEMNVEGDSQCGVHLIPGKKYWEWCLRPCSTELLWTQWVKEMAYDEGLAERLRTLFQNQAGVAEKKMFGGLTFMVRGHMCCGVTGEDLMVRVRSDQFDDAVLLPHARPMDFTGRPMKGFVFVDSTGVESDEQLTEWVDRGLEFVSTLPPR